jgi:hypothetical protein
MSRVVVRFQSLVLRDEGSRSTIHFDVEDDAAIARCRASVDERDDAVHVGPVEGYRGAIDHAEVARVVARIYREQLARIERLAGGAPLHDGVSCIVGLAERDLVLGGSHGAEWKRPA